MLSTPSKSVHRSSAPVALNYREEGTLTQDMYTDRLWQSALVADSIRLELQQPLHDELMSTTSSKNSDDGLIETAKAFLPVAIEIGAVAALAANIPIN